MSGMTVIFHLASAVFTVLLLYWLLRMQKQRDLLRLLMTTTGRKVVVESPLAFLEAFAAALAVPMERSDGAKAPPPARIEPSILAELFSSRGITLIRWKAQDAKEPVATVELTLGGGAAGAKSTLQAADVAKALGGDVRVVFA